MTMILRLLILLCACSGTVSAHAQIINPPSQPVIPYPTAPPPPPPPSMAVPQVPQMASPPKFELQNTSPSVVGNDAAPQPKIRRPRRESFGDRAQRCLDEGAAMGYGPNGRAAYSRSCVTR